VVTARLAYAAYSHIGYDDAHISLRYAVNLATGHGLVYNPGERVFGASTPLYVLLLAVFARLGLPMPLFSGPAPLAWGKALCVAADAITALVWYGILTRETGSRWPGRFFVLLFALSPFILETSVSGMETSLVLLAMSLCLGIALREPAAPGKSGMTALQLGAAIGLLGLLRPDGLLYGAVVLAFYTYWTRRPPGRVVLVSVACLAPWYLYAWHFYGSPVPNSVFAKVAAYNDHTSSYSLGALSLWGSIGPYHNGFGAEGFKWVSFLLLLAGLLQLRSHPRLWVLPAAIIAYLAFLILPHTLLFRWYLPPLLMPLYALSGLGVLAVRGGEGEKGRSGEGVNGRNEHAGEVSEQPLPRPFTPSPLHPFTPSPPVRALALSLLWLALAVHTAFWTGRVAVRARRIQWAENHIRRDIGLWLRQHAPAGARVAAEPIGYIGFYSERPILDEVGLVSPRMIPLNRQGDGWFGKMIRAELPDYVVERYYYLHRNETLNSGVRMFASDSDREWFDEEYEPVKYYCWDLTQRLKLSSKMTRDYAFVIFERRTPAAGARLTRSPTVRSRPRLP
jgi:hypothetical protein